MPPVQSPVAAANVGLIVGILLAVVFLIGECHIYSVIRWGISLLKQHKNLDPSQCSRAQLLKTDNVIRFC